MLSGWFFSLRGGLVHFVRRKLVTLWLPFVAANTVFTVCNNLFLRLNILTADARIAEIPGNSVTAPVNIKDIIGRTVHWCVFDGGTQLGGAMWFIQALFQISLLYAVIEVLLQKLLHGGDTLIPQGLLSGVLLWVGWHCNQIGWNVWGWALRPAATGCSTWHGAAPHCAVGGAPAVPGGGWRSGLCSAAGAAAARLGRAGGQRLY